jgi:hypothetical protein
MGKRIRNTTPKTRKQNHGQDGGKRKPYSSPELQVYGALRELTLGGSGGGGDGASGMVPKAKARRVPY